MRLVDQIGNTIRLDKPAQRIVSIVPSQTEFLHDIDLDDEVVGITKFCIHPKAWFQSKNRVGGTKNVDLEKVRALNPDLIIANKEENDKENIAELRKIAPVYMSDIFNLDDSFEMMRQIGELTNRKEESQFIIEKIKDNFRSLKPFSSIKKALYFIWREPWMLAGKSTFIDSILDKWGLENAIGVERYPVVEIENLPACDFVLLSSEPYPFKEKHIAEIRKQLPLAKVMLVDGEIFSWYGSRLLKAPEYLNNLKNQLS
ncbi:MAG: iron complex transport system substrate-binding protein [Lentimonas sp.]|jgi:iron complex transport system substrate-binding protein